MFDSSWLHLASWASIVIVLVKCAVKVVLVDLGSVLSKHCKLLFNNIDLFERSLVSGHYRLLGEMRSQPSI